MAMIQSSSSFSSLSYGFTYDVFLSFRGIDTRYSFTGNIYRALSDAGIHTFIDDRELHGGDEITPSLLKAIEESRIFIPVFSINYASSSFCLDELVHIIHCFETKGCLVLPVFYDVEPTHVRHQTGSYVEAIARLEERLQNNKEKLHKWKMALNKAASLSGYHFNPRNGYEYEFIQEIVKYVSNKINRVPLHVVDYPVGLQSRILKVNSLLEVGSIDEVKMLGIYGPGGMGKSTLARAVSNFIADQFECVCFLHNVRENSEKHGLDHLQKDFLSKTVGLDIKIGDSYEGIPIIRKRLHRKKLLLILDDVDTLKQLQALAGGLDWFGAGSRVIVTTRDRNLLAVHGIEVAYEIDELNTEEALELIRHKAFKGRHVDSSYEHILIRAVNYASGFPLALEILGSDLFAKHIDDWNSLLERYEKIPNKEIQKILKVSFDALEEDEQSVFLDIACCFKGYHLKEMEDMLCAHYGRYMKYHIGVLVEKSLVKISKEWYVTLHDLIEDMGKEIVRQESPNEPGKRSRLWFHEDIFQVLEENSGTSRIEIIHLDFPLAEEIVDWIGDEFKKMKNLKTLVVKTSFILKSELHLPISLRVLIWYGYPSQHIPFVFCPKNLSICKLPNSGLSSFHLPKSIIGRMFLAMKSLILDDSQCLTQINDVSGLQNLEEFSFQWCENLLTIHDSVGFLDKLKFLNAKGCTMLKSFPPIKLTSLQQLELSFCNRLQNFPEILGKIENVRVIFLLDTSIDELPDSFLNLTELRVLKVEGHGTFLGLPSIILMMPNLSDILFEGFDLLSNKSDKPNSTVCSNVKSFGLRCCDLTDSYFPIALKWFANLTSLFLSSCNITILPECIKDHLSLVNLYLNDCKSLQEIRGIPPNLKYLSALNCESLSSSCRSMLLNQELHEVGSTLFCLPGTSIIPEWFEYENKGSSISFWFRNKLPSIALLCTTGWMNNKNFTKDYTWTFSTLFINGYECYLGYPLHSFPVQPGHTYLLDLQLEKVVVYDEALLKSEWNHAEVTVQDSDMISLLKGSRMHIFKQESSMEDFQFTNPYRNRELDDDDDDDDENGDDDDDVFYDVDDVFDDDNDDNHHLQ